MIPDGNQFLGLWNFFLFDQDAFVCVMVNETALVPNDDGDGDDACVLYSVLYCTV